MNKTRMSIITGSIQHCTDPGQHSKKRKRKKSKRIEREVTKLSQFPEDMIIHVEKSPKPYK